MRLGYKVKPYLDGVRADYRTLKDVPKPQISKLIRAALNTDGRAIQFVDNQTHKLCVKAVRNTPSAINFVTNFETIRWLVGRDHILISCITDKEIRDRIVTGDLPCFFRFLDSPTIDQWSQYIKLVTYIRGNPSNTHMPKELWHTALQRSISYLWCIPVQFHTYELIIPYQQDFINLRFTNCPLDLKNRLAGEFPNLISFDYVFLDADERTAFALASVEKIVMQIH